MKTLILENQGKPDIIINPIYIVSAHISEVDNKTIVINIFTSRAKGYDIVTTVCETEEKAQEIFEEINNVIQSI